MIFIAIMIGMGVSHWLIYTGLLWLMIKIQKLDYNLLGLFGSSLAATVLGYIPFVGFYVGWVVLVICLWKCTGADIAPDVLFTVGVAGALMFCVKLFAIGALMTHLALAGPSLLMGGEADGAGADAEETLLEHRGGRPTSSPNDDDIRGISPLSNLRPQPQAVPVISNTLPAVVITSSAEGRFLTGRLKLKGVNVNASGKSAMITDGTQIHTVGPGEILSVAGSNGRVTLVCEDITQSSVTLALEHGEKITIGFR
jgi:hypothetical protein